MKRKATTPPVGASAEPSAGLKKAKAQEDWSCTLCRITATSERALNDHLQGKKHKARESGLNSQRTGFGTGPLPKTGSTSTGKPIKVPSATNESSVKKDKRVHNAPKQLPGTDNKPEKETCVKKKENSLSAMPQKSQVSAKAKNKLRFFCEVCQVSTHALKVLNAHKRGKRHLEKVALLNKINEGASGESSAQKGVVEERKDNKETDIAIYVEKAVVEEKMELDFNAAVEEMKNETTDVEQVRSNKETIDCDVTGVEEDEVKVLETVGDVSTVAKSDVCQQLV